MSTTNCIILVGFFIFFIDMEEKNTIQFQEKLQLVFLCVEIDKANPSFLWENEAT